MALAALLALALLALLALAAPLLPLPDPDATDLDARLLAPLSPAHPLGTDQLGRDILSRVVWGMRVSLAVGLVAALGSGLAGSLIGLVAGYAGRWPDAVLMRGVDVLMAFPYLLLALAIVAALGPGLLNALLAVAVVNVPFFARAVRGSTVTLARREFVDAARLSGLSETRILLTEVLPNVMPVIVITVSTTVGWMILETAGLSFLGLGAQPPRADLGSMLGEGRRLFIPAPHVATVPGLVIFGLVVAINVLGDAVRDLLDPRLRAAAAGHPAAATRVAAAARESAPAGDPPAGAAALRLEGLRTWFRTGDGIHRAADDVSFEVRAGECLGIVGESGCGKSVTALSVTALVPSPPGRIEGGRILYRGRNLVGAPLPVLRELRGRGIAYVFQDPRTSLDPLFPVGEQIAEAILAHQDLSPREARGRALEWLERVRLPDAQQRAAAFPHELSGGMRQRVVIAMALANDPQVLIADEPTTALDVTTQAEILRLLRGLCRERGTALVFITHDFGVISGICDRVLVMYSGQVVETGGVEEILEAPCHPYTRRLIGCVPRLGEPERELDAIPGLPPPVNDLPLGCYFADRCDVVIDACRRRPVALDELAPGRSARCIRAREAPAPNSEKL